MVGGVAVMIGIYAVALTTFGFLLATTVLIYVLYAVGDGRLVSLRSLVLAVLAAVAAYLVFVVARSVRKPGGTVWGL